MKLYTDLVPWYDLIDPVEDHEDEAVTFHEVFSRAVTPRAQSLLELGSGAGHNAFFMKKHYHCTLTDISEGMLARSHALNGECEHVSGDMRTMRLDRQFDAVLVHDGIVYMCSRAELEAALETAYVHLRPGGAAVIAPDGVRDDFKDDHVELLECTRGERAMRGLQWTWDPDASDETVQTDYAFVLRDGSVTTVAHDVHVSGMFWRATWLELLASTGFAPELIERPLGDGRFDRVFLARK